MQSLTQKLKIHRKWFMGTILWVKICQNPKAPIGRGSEVDVLMLKGLAQSQVCVSWARVIMLSTHESISIPPENFILSSLSIQTLFKIKLSITDPLTQSTFLSPCLLVIIVIWMLRFSLVLQIIIPWYLDPVIEYFCQQRVAKWRLYLKISKCQLQVV